MKTEFNQRLLKSIKIKDTDNRFEESVISCMENED